MRSMERNKRPFYYCLFVRSDSITDEYGDETGESFVTYAPAVEMKASISASVGEAQIEQFGNLGSYDKVIITDDMSSPIDENTVLFIGKKPEYGKSGEPLYNYQVRRVARSLNHIAYAVSEVTVS